MQIRDWIANATEDDGFVKLRVILKSGNELEVEYSPDNDVYGSEDELTDGNYMIDARSIAAIMILS